VPLDDLAATALAGPPVADLDSAEGVEAVTPSDVQNAEQAAEVLEAEADEAEQQAVIGTVAPADATSSRERARFARLHAHLTAEQRRRHVAAERIRGLDEVGKNAVRHAAKLKGLRDSTLADLATINELLAAMRKRITDWNSGLADIARRGEELHPDPVPPSGVPPATSAHVSADHHGGVIVRRRIIRYIDQTADPAGLPGAIGIASGELPAHDPDQRLILGENGLITPLPPDPGGSWQRRIDAGIIRELTADERDAWYRGEIIDWSASSHA